MNPILTSCYCHQNVMVQTIQSFAYTYMLKSILQDGIDLALDLKPLNCNKYDLFLSLGTVGD